MDVTLVIGCDVRMGAADWTEIEGGVTGPFQVLAQLQGGRLSVVSIIQITNKKETRVTVVTAAVCTWSLQVTLWLNTASSLIGSLLSVNEIVIRSSSFKPNVSQNSESSASISALCRKS